MSSAVGYLCMHVSEKGWARDIRINDEKNKRRGRQWRDIKEEIRSDRHLEEVKNRGKKTRSEEQSDKGRNSN